jgi:sec-independent protein translocase protein TatA
MNCLTTTLAAMPGGFELILILGVVVLLFGAKKLPELAKGMGQSIKEFKKASKEEDSESATESDKKSSIKAESNRTHGSN